MSQTKLATFKTILISVYYIEDITWLCGDTDFKSSSVYNISYEWAKRTSERCFQHKKSKSVSPSSILYVYGLFSKYPQRNKIKLSKLDLAVRGPRSEVVHKKKHSANSYTPDLFIM